MRVIVPAVLALLIAILPGAVLAQDREAEPFGQQVASADSPPISPSSGNATVSPATVPHATERMTDHDMVGSLSLGTGYAEGRFGTDTKTTIWSSAVGARLRLGDWALSASLPYMRIRSRSTAFTGIDATPVLIAPNTSARRRTHRGLGDLTLGASYTIAPARLPIELELSGRAKINTATDRSRLSSGENDYAVGVDFSIPMGRVTPFGSVSYRFLGDTQQYRLRDGPAASAGASYAFNPKSYALVSYHYSRAATASVEDAHELFAGATTRMPGSPLRLTGFATAGLSRGAAAASAGLAVSLGFGNRDAR